MTVLSRELEISLPAEVVWAQLVDLSNWPLWVAGINRAGWADDAPLKEGSRLWFRLQHAQKSTLVQAELSEYRERRELSYRPIAGENPYTQGMEDIEWEWLLYTRGSNRTSLRFTLSYDASGGMPFFRELVGTRVQVLNTADTSLRTLRALAAGTAGGGVRGEA